jgi:hypothetical protein
MANANVERSNIDKLIRSKIFKLIGKKAEGAMKPPIVSFTSQDSNLSMWVDSGEQGSKSVRVPFGPLQFTNFISAVEEVNSGKYESLQVIVHGGDPKQPYVAANILIAKSATGIMFLTFTSDKLSKPLSFGIYPDRHIIVLTKSGDKLSDLENAQRASNSFITLLKAAVNHAILTTYTPYVPPNGGGNGGYNKGGQQGGGYQQGGGHQAAKPDMNFDDIPF